MARRRQRQGGRRIPRPVTLEKLLLARLGANLARTTSRLPRKDVTDGRVTIGVSWWPASSSQAIPPALVVIQRTRRVGLSRRRRRQPFNRPAAVWPRLSLRPEVQDPRFEDKPQRAPASRCPANGSGGQLQGAGRTAFAPHGLTHPPFTRSPSRIDGPVSERYLGLDVDGPAAGWSRSRRPAGAPPPRREQHQ